MDLEITKSMTISELEYNQLQLTIQQLMGQLSKFRQPLRLKKQDKTPIANRLHGVLATSVDFDDKQILEDEILKKYLGNG
jgi:hypothetical protein